MKKLYACLLILSSASSLFSVHVIFDLGGTLVRPNKLAVGQSIGALNALRFFVEHGHDTGDILHTTLFDVLYDGAQPTITPTTPRGPNGLAMPLLMQDWLKGTRSGADLRAAGKQAATSYGKYQNETEKQLITRLIRWLFTPRKYVHGLTTIKPMVKLLKDIANARGDDGHRKNQVFILSNFDRPSFEKMYANRRFASIFKHIPRSHIVISGNYGLLKPDPAFYTILLNKTGIDPTNSIYIDDQQENVDAARKLGMRAILFKKNSKTIEEQLKNLGVI